MCELITDDKCCDSSGSRKNQYPQYLLGPTVSVLDPEPKSQLLCLYSRTTKRIQIGKTTSASVQPNSCLINFEHRCFLVSIKYAPFRCHFLVQCSKLLEVYADGFYSIFVPECVPYIIPHMLH